MKKFGFGSKRDDDSDPNRSGLFGRKKESPAPQNDNPYAQAPVSDPYANPVRTRHQPPPRQGLPSGPRAGGLPNGPGPQGSPSQTGPPPPYSSHGGNSGYSSEKLGASGGYGNNRYDNAAAFGANQQVPPIGGSNPYSSGPAGRQSPYAGSASSSLHSQSNASVGGSGSQPGARRPGGYGGMSGPDPNRSDLFGGAQERYAQKQAQAPQNQPGGDEGVGGSSYGGYGDDRELTEEEKVRNETRGYAHQIRDLRDQSERSLDNTNEMIFNSLNLTGETAQRLQEQRHRLEHAGENLDHAARQNLLAAEQTKELQRANRSMFVPMAGNPFTSKRRMAAKQEEMMQRHQLAREQRDQQREEALANDRAFAKSMETGSQQRRPGQSSAADHSKFIFLDDDDDPDKDENNARDNAQEGRIDQKLNTAVLGVSILNQRARAMNQELERHIGIIDRNIDKTDVVDDGITRNRNALHRVERKG